MKLLGQYSKESRVSEIKVEESKKQEENADENRKETEVSDRWYSVDFSYLKPFINSV